MAAIAYTWAFARDLAGTRIPVITTLKAAASLETKIGTPLMMVSGQVSPAVGSVTSFIGLAAQDTAAALSANDPIKVELIAPGMLIKGTATADISAAEGFSGKTYDFASDGRLDQGDSANGCLSVHRTEDSGLTVWATVTKFAAF
jgi:hypothetical protein